MGRKLGNGEQRDQSGNAEGVLSRATADEARFSGSCEGPDPALLLTAMRSLHPALTRLTWGTERLSDSHKVTQPCWSSFPAHLLTPGPHLWESPLSYQTPA